VTPEAVALGAVTLWDLHPPPERLREDVVRGLSARPRKLPPKYFYDERGALLFEKITRLEAYYPTRTELGILERRVGEMAHAIGPGARVVEFGSGSGLKTRILLRHLEDPVVYLPVDISRAQLVRFALSVADEFPELEVFPVCADYTAEWVLPPREKPARRNVAFFPGSTIGNFERHEASAFLARVARLCGPGGALLIGVDLHKDTAVLERAYDDPEGVTARFNLNLLARINRECGTDFDLEGFRHHAFYDETRRRIEMRLVAERDLEVELPCDGSGSLRFRFAAGDFITTEYSHKYTPEDFGGLAAAAGWSVERMWSDERGWFGVWLLEVEGGTAPS